MRKMVWAAFALLVLSSMFFILSRQLGGVDESTTAQIGKWDWLLGYRKKVINVQKVTWAGHLFERGVLSTNQYKTTGNKDIKFTNSGFMLPAGLCRDRK